MISFTVIFLLILLLLFGYNSYPPPGSDSCDYIPPAINYSLGNGLVNQIHDISIKFDKLGKHRFLFYPPLFQLLLSFLMWKPTPQCAFIIIEIVNWVAILISALIFYKIATLKLNRLNWYSTLLICLSLIGLTSSTGGTFEGRPDILATVFILIGTYILVNFTSIKIISFALGVLLGLIGATHPSAFITSTIIIGMYYSFKFSGRRFIFLTAITYLIAIIVFYLVMLLSPYGILETLQAILGQSKYGVTEIGLHYSFWTYFFFLPKVSFYGLVLFLSIFFSFFLYLRYKYVIASKNIFLIFSILLLFDIWFFSFRSFNRNYNLFLFSPILFLSVIHYAVNESNKFTVKLISIFFVLLTTLGFVRSVVLFPFYLKYGVSIDKARQLFNDVYTKNKNCHAFILTGSSLWVLSEKYNKMQHINLVNLKGDLNKKDYVMLFQQNYSGLLKPPDKIRNYYLAENYFVPHYPKLFGIKLANTMPGYSFAVYKKSRK